MALFAISYDLVKRKDYPKLWEEFERLDGHKPVNSVYLINLDNTAVEDRDHIQQFIDDDDRLIVIEFDKRPQCGKVYKGTAAWIKANV